jgi:lactoylglutathione lyase
MRLSYVIVFVSDMSRSVEFYRDILQLSVRFESSHWSEFATDGVTLALHLERGTLPPMTSGAWSGTSRPGFSVPDLDRFHRRMREQGVTCAQEPKEVFGARIAQYLDPDGLVISVSQERADRS